MANRHPRRQEWEEDDRSRKGRRTRKRNRGLIRDKIAGGTTKDWAMRFEATDVLRWQYLNADVPDRVLKRVGKRNTSEVRQARIDRELSRLSGKW